MEKRTCDRCGELVTGPGIPGLADISERYCKKKGAFVCPMCFSEIIQELGEGRFHEIIGDQPVRVTPESAAETEEAGK